MKAIILAAGRGSRMANETSSKPKCLVQYKSKPLLHHTLASLRSFFDEKDVLIIGGYKSELLEGYWPSIRNNFRWADTNIMGSLMVASDILSREEVLVIYSDIYFEGIAIELMLQGSKPSILNLVNWREIWESRFDNPLDDLENFSVRDSKVVRIGGKPSDLNEVTGQFGGMYTLNPDYWNHMMKIPDLENMDTTSTLNLLIGNGKSFTSIPYSAPWAEFDSILDLEKQTSYEK